MEEIIILYKKDILEQTDRLREEFHSIQEHSDLDNLVRKGQIIAQLEIYTELLKQAV